MIDGKMVLGLIPARAGSKAIKLKNIQGCAGKPLIQWTIEAAKASKYIDEVAVSSDSDTILNATAGVTRITRPAELAADDTEMAPVILDALQYYRYPICVLLQPTSPLRTAADIDGALELLMDRKAKTVVSVYESHAVEFDGTEPLRRQDRKPSLMLNGAIYAFKVDVFRETGALIDERTVPYVMPQERSIDIDVPLDMALASLLIGGA